tara:strand:- start:65 stop:289 length:225 start_codon:yes stop_codon:yes gene_type:complete
MKHKNIIWLCIAIIISGGCNKQQNDVVMRPACDCIDGLILKKYESATGEFNYAEDVCEFIGTGRPILETEKARR